MKIRSLPKHGGELICLLETPGNKFDSIVLTEIEGRNLSTVECLLHYDEFFDISSENSIFRGVGIYISDNISDV